MTNHTLTKSTYPISKFESPLSISADTDTLQPLNTLRRRPISCSKIPSRPMRGKKKYLCPIYGTSCHRYHRDKKFFSTLAEVKKDINEHLLPYHCPRCDYQTAKLSHKKRHLKKKRKCTPKDPRKNVPRLPDVVAVNLITSLSDAKSYQEVCVAVKQFQQFDVNLPPKIQPSNSGIQIPQATISGRTTALTPDLVFQPSMQELIPQETSECQAPELQDVEVTLSGQSMPFSGDFHTSSGFTSSTIIPNVGQDQTAQFLYDTTLPTHTHWNSEPHSEPIPLSGTLDHGFADTVGTFPESLEELLYWV